MRIGSNSLLIFCERKLGDFLNQIPLPYYSSVGAEIIITFPDPPIIKPRRDEIACHCDLSFPMVRGNISPSRYFFSQNHFQKIFHFPMKTALARYFQT